MPEYRGRGGPPSRKKPQAGWKHLQMVKQRRKGRVIGVKAKSVYGDEREVPKLLGQSTSYVERTNLTSRHIERQVGEEDIRLLQRAADVEGVLGVGRCGLYNLGRALKSLRLESPETGNQRWIRRSPAMAAGLTEHIWKIEEILTVLPLPSTNT